MKKHKYNFILVCSLLLTISCGKGEEIIYNSEIEYTHFILEHNNNDDKLPVKKYFFIKKDSLFISKYDNYENKYLIGVKVSDSISKIITNAFIKKIDPDFYNETNVNQGNKDTTPFVKIYLNGYRNEYGYKNKQATYYNVSDLYNFIPELENVLKELKLNVISDENLCCF